MLGTRGFRALLAATLVGAALVSTLVAQAGSKPSSRAIWGAGTTIVEGGTGAPSFAPLITKVAFRWRDGEGQFECLALTPSAPAGSAGSGNFDMNVMYVVGKITSGTIKGRTAVLKGTSTVTGVGAGEGRAFTATVTRGGPGSTLVLEVSGLTFKEILLEGQFKF